MDAQRFGPIANHNEPTHRPLAARRHFGSDVVKGNARRILGRSFNRGVRGGHLRLANARNVEDFRRAARRALPRPIFDYIDGGADDEWTLRSNSAAFGRWEILPEVLVDTTKIRTATTLFGREIRWPLMLSPTGLARMFHAGAELAVARAAARHNLP